MLLTNFLKLLINKKWTALLRLNTTRKKVSSMSSNNSLYCIHKKSLLKTDWCLLKVKQVGIFIQNEAIKKDTVNIYLRPSKEKDLACKTLIKNGVFPEPFQIIPSVTQDLQTLITQYIIKNLKNIEIENWKKMQGKYNIALRDMEKLCWNAHKTPTKLHSENCKQILSNLSNNLTNLNEFELYYCLKLLELWKKPLNINCGKEKRKFMIKIGEILYTKIKNMPITFILLINYSFLKLQFHSSLFTCSSMILLQSYNLDHNNLLRYAFLLRAHKNIPCNLFNIEQCCIRNAYEMDINELAIVASVFYKYQYTISDKLSIILINGLIKNINSIDSIFISTIIKVVKMNNSTVLQRLHYKLLVFLEDWVSKLNSLTLTHIAHLQARSYIRNDNIMLEIMKRSKNGLEDLRIKDIERITYTLFQLDYKPETISFYYIAANELIKFDRLLEIKRFPLQFLYFTKYLFQANYFNEKLLTMIMAPEFAYSLPIEKLNYEYFMIEKCLELDRPDYLYPKLSNSFLSHSYRNVQRMIQNESKSCLQAHFMTDVMEHLKTLLGSDINIYLDILLPHMVKNDIIICYDKKNDRYLSPRERLSSIPKGTIKYAPKDGNIWYAIVCFMNILKTSDHTCNDHPICTGTLGMHLRHLKSAGYKPIAIHFGTWNTINKFEYLNNILIS